MDNVPFTLFFMVCLLSFQGSVMGKPASDADMKAIPEPCLKQFRTQNYCDKRPSGYPDDNKLIRLYNENIGIFDLQPQINETGHRDDEKEHICLQKPYLVEHIYMIKAENDEIRYAFYLPKLYNAAIPVMKCKDANKRLHDMYKKKKIQCEQKYFQYPFIVLSRDMNSLESVKIKGLESSCDPILKYK